MSHLPPPLPPLDDALSLPDQPPVRRSRAGVVIAWIVILCCVAAMVVLPHRMKRAAATKGPTTNPSPAVAPRPVEEVPGGPLEIISRYAVGLKDLSAGGGASVPVAALLKQVENASSNPIDELRAITVVGELAGAKEALARLDRFEKQHTFVRLRPDVDALRRLYTKGTAELSAADARLLINRHHWFGELAISYDLPSSDPRRAAVLEAARRTMMLAGAAAMIGLAVALAGLVLAIVAIVLISRGRLRRRFEPPTPWAAGPMAEAFALYLAGMIGVSILLAWWFGGGELGSTFLLFLLLPVAMIYLRLRGIGWGEVMRGLGWTRGRGFLRELGAGVVGYVAGLPLVALGMFVTLKLIEVTGNMPTHPIQDVPIDRPWAVLELLLLAAVGAPIVEETMFRGALLGHLRSRLGWWISAPIVSLIFAAIHPQGWVAIPTLGAIAMVLAALREWRGSLIASMTGHALNNAVAVLVMVMVMK